MANFAGAAGGAITGAQLGSSFGAPGAIAGGLIGGVAGLFGSKKKKPKKKSTLDPQQQKLYNDYVSSIRGQGGPFSGLYNFDANQQNNVFDQTVGRQAYREFREKNVPEITGAFRANNLQNSSYAGEALARRGRDVQENLDALRAQYQFAGQQEAQQRQQRGIQDILGMNTQAYVNPDQQPNTIDKILGGLAPMAGQTFGDYLTRRRDTQTQQANIAGQYNGMSNSVINALR